MDYKITDVIVNMTAYHLFGLMNYQLKFAIFMFRLARELEMMVTFTELLQHLESWNAGNIIYVSWKRAYSWIIYCAKCCFLYFSFIWRFCFLFLFLLSLSEEESFLFPPPNSLQIYVCWNFCIRKVNRQGTQS